MLFAGIKRSSFTPEGSILLLFSFKGCHNMWQIHADLSAVDSGLASAKIYDQQQFSGQRRDRSLSLSPDSHWVSLLGQHVLHPRVWWQLWMCTLSQWAAMDQILCQSWRSSQKQETGPETELKTRYNRGLRGPSRGQAAYSKGLRCSQRHPEAGHTHEAARAGSGCIELSRNGSPVWQAEVCRQVLGRSWSGLLGLVGTLAGLQS